MKPKKRNTVTDMLKSARRKSREEEISTHGKPINYKKVVPSKKVYKRKKYRAGRNDLPFLVDRLTHRPG